MKKRMLIIHHCGMIGGAGNSLLLFLSCIDSTKYDVVVYTKSSDSKKMYELLSKDKNITIKECGEYPAIFNFYSGNEKILINPWNIINYYKNRKTKRYIKDIVELERLDVLVLNTMTLAYLGKTLKEYPCKKIIFDRETFGKELFPIRNSLIKRDLKKYFDKTVYLSRYDMNCVNGNNGIIITDKYQQIEVREKYVFDRNKKNILFVGGNILFKGVGTVIHSLKYLPNEYVLHVIGCKELISDKMKKNWRAYNPFSNYYQLRKLDKFIDDNGLRKRIEFHGSVTNPQDYMSVADALIIPTIKQHQSRPFIEGGFLKVPIVISNMSCMREFIHNEENCLSFEIGNSKALSDCIRRLENEELKNKLIQNQFEFVNKYFNLEDYSFEIDDLLNDIE